MDALPFSNAYRVRDNIHNRSPLTSLNDNKLPSTATKPQPKTAPPRLPHPLSLNVLASLINKWSPVSHPIQG
jgi:hypothetical protein